MMNAIDLERLARRIEALQLVSTYGWDSADELEFKKQLPGGRDPVRALPLPAYLRNPTTEVDYKNFRHWVQITGNLEHLVTQNRIGSAKRLIRDLACGKIPIPFL